MCPSPPPFCDELTTSAPSSSATRVSAAGQHARLVSRRGRRTAAGRRDAARAGRRSTVGWVESVTSSWATNRVGRARDRRARPRRRPRARRAGRSTTPSPPKPPRGLTTSSARRRARARAPGLAEVEGRDRGQQRLLAEVEADHVLDVGVDELVVGDAGAERVDDAERARAQRLEQQLGRRSVSSAVLVGAPVDDVDGRRGRARTRSPRTRGRGRAERHVERRASCVLLVGGVGGAVGEQHDRARPSRVGRGGASAPQQRGERRRAAAAVGRRGTSSVARRRAPRGDRVGEAARACARCPRAPGSGRPRRGPGRGRRCRSRRRRAAARRAARARSGPRCRSPARA